MNDDDEVKDKEDGEKEIDPAILEVEDDADIDLEEIDLDKDPLAKDEPESLDAMADEEDDDDEPFDDVDNW